MKTTSFLSGVVLTLALAPLLGAQVVSESIQVTLVQVPVTVVDRSGAPVRNLTAEDFEIFDDGKKKPIVSFEVIDLAAVGREEPAEPLHPAAYRNFLFLFDLTNSSPGTIQRARESARDFIENELGSRDLAAVATFSVEHGVRLLTNFTTDRTLVGAAVETLGHPNFFRVSDPLLISAEVSSPEGGTDPGGRSRIGDAIYDTVTDANRLAEQGNEAYKRARLRTQLQQFQNLARVIDRLQGQKQVILLSEGFDARLVQGRENLSSDASREEAEAALAGEVWKIETDKRFGSSTASNEISEMAEIFRRSDVVLHAFDIRGLRADVDAREGLKRSSNEALFLLSDPTGGKVFKNANDLSSSLRKMLDQQQLVYVLGFRAGPSTEPGKFHDLKVRTTGVRGARVQHRAGYYEPSAEPSPLERALTASEILFHDLPLDQVGVRMNAVPFPNGGRSQVPVVLEIDGARLLEAIDGDQARGDIFIYAFEPGGKVAAYLHQQLSLDLSKAAGLLRKAGIRYYGTLMLDQGKSYELKTLVRVGENDLTGFRSAPLHVPDFSQPTVSSPLLLAEQGDWIMLRAEYGEGIDYPFVIGGRSFVPGVLPTLAADETSELALFTYHVPPEQLRLSALLRSEQGAMQAADVQVVGRTPADEQGSVKYLFQFTPRNVPAGRYDLELTINPENQAERTVNMPLVVE